MDICSTIHCNALQHSATQCNTLQHMYTLSSKIRGKSSTGYPLDWTLQHTATHCNTLQYTATHGICCNACVHHHLRRGADDQWDIPPTSVLIYVRSYIYVFIYTCRHATRLKTLQHTATHCNTLQHTATHWKVCSVLHLDAASAWLTEILDSTLHTCIHASIYICRHTSRHYTTHMYTCIYVHM